MADSTAHLSSGFKLLKRTRSRCPSCRRLCPAEVRRVEGQPSEIHLWRVCPEHGEATVSIASEARFYWESHGRPENADCGCAGAACRASDGQAVGTLGINAVGRGGSPFETLSTCLALIEIVHSCNLPCPTCYAGSPMSNPGTVDAVPLPELQSRIEAVIDRKGGIEILQLSGGEPTLHPRFLELLEWAQEHPRIDYVLVNTNGVRIAQDDGFLEGLREAPRRGNVQLYLQYDGPEAAGHRALRGADFRELKHRALDRCQAIGLPVTLAMTVTPETLPQLWPTVAFGLRHPHVRGVSFQPLFHSGRLPERGAAGILIGGRRLNVADIILGLVAQAEGRLQFEDFTPLPCGDPNCATIGYLLRTPQGIRSISEFVDFTQVQGFLRDRVRYSLADLQRCGCENEPLGALLKGFEMDESHTFRLFIKPFMDAWTWDEDRIDRCCTHVIGPDGRLDSFCRYYLNGAAGEVP